ncbi:hypothetical protein [Arthrobacter sp. ES3-54]|uniref:hypothetical protein n=1 Tax=Arthrobacter sp. ES3-54 TaxID=1502991 RepID=UPI002406A5B4|nr:hypothetical protein [Arthrobacter sp. ES3-54]MDF9751531.1 hypothetical protein [Arthrobacter sp. ES3-54]
MSRRGVRPQRSTGEDRTTASPAFGGDLPARLAQAEAGFGQRMKVMLDARKGMRG